MNTAKTWQIESSSSEDTFDVGKQLGSKCRGGEVFLLKSDLGGGKTTFVKGLAKGMGSKDQVGSPTYTINRVYSCDNSLELQHFDFYRLEDAGIVALELSEVINEPKTVVAVEWGNIVDEVLPERKVIVEFNRLAANEGSRKLCFSYHNDSNYLFEDLK